VKSASSSRPPASSIPAERILAKVVDCDDFQDARKFLVNDGEKGRQLGF